ncbi:unnamed protein product [Hymenolepis diminuta]|uniref:BEN domain-containing protein n=1 Tax=Hymenolepis diminuta TaxID=6216 RepID=A0A0R3SWB0_HYMDI|nr:unnamed protein product [Hymenolepis diminuta]VUZ51292.1 unnamed protein product [Hymenolepis diminuta]
MESMTEPHNSNETSAGSLGLGEALAVAYDLQEDPNYSQSNYSHPESTTLSFSTSAGQQSGVLVLPKSPYYSSYPPAQQVRYHAGDPYWEVSGCPQTPQSRNHVQTAVPMTAYLNPIPVSSPVICSRGPDNGSYFIQSVPHPQMPSTVLTPSLVEPITYFEGGPASESTMSTDSMLSVRSDTFPTYTPPSDMGYSIKPVPQPPVMSSNGHHNSGIMNGNGNSHHTPSSSSSRRHDDQRQAAVPSTGSDDGLYELSEEDVKEIDDMLMQNPQITSSRHWKYYIETNEWTRATCALMACLFTRDQMANSTVLGRGGSQRERLPTNLVAYVVTKMRRRFNKSAAAVRARMAQKCKDERRFGRVLPSGVIATNSDSSNPGVAALTSSVVGSRQSSTSGRRRSAAFLTGTPPIAKIPRLSMTTPTTNPSPAAQSIPPQLPHQPNNSSSVLTSPSSEVYPTPTQSASNQQSASTSVVHDPPVILASAPDMAS